MTKKEVITSLRLLIVKQILLVSTMGNVKRIVWRICILILGCKGLILFGVVSLSVFTGCAIF